MSIEAWMKNDPLVLNEAVLRTVFRKFAVNLGLSQYYSDAVAVVAIGQYRTLFARWTTFLVEQCGTCDCNPASCAFFSPPPQAVVGRGDISSEVREANVEAVSLGRLARCPARDPKNPG